MSKLINFYELLPDELKVKKVPNIGFKNHGITMPCRILISGSSNQGKTLSILNYLKLCQDKKKGQYDRITVITKKIEPLYEYIKMKSPKNVDIIEMTDDDSVIPDIESFNGAEQNFVIFDDLITSKHLMKDIKEFFIRGRKLKPYSLNMCFITQDFRATDPMIRKNVSHFWIFKPTTEREKTVMYQDIPILKNKELWDRLGKKKNHDDPSNFINIDVANNNARINFEKI
jgi:uncharacterized protein (DUF302 family)